MTVRWSPVRTDQKVTYRIQGEKIIVKDGEEEREYDFSLFSDGRLEWGEGRRDAFVPSAERIDGVLTVVLCRPHGREALESERFPEDSEITGPATFTFPAEAPNED